MYFWKVLLATISPSPLPTLHPFYETWNCAFTEEAKYLLNSWIPVVRRWPQGLSYSGSHSCNSITTVTAKKGKHLLRFFCLYLSVPLNTFPLDSCRMLVTLLFLLSHHHAIWISSVIVFMQKNGGGALNCQSTSSPLHRVLRYHWNWFRNHLVKWPNPGMVWLCDMAFSSVYNQPHGHSC